MNNSSDLLTIFYAVASFQGFFISILLFIIKKGNRRANKILGVLILFLSFYLLDQFFGFIGVFRIYPNLLHIVTPLWYLFPPLSYFYIKLLFQKPIKMDWKLFLHLIPFLFVLVRLIPFYQLPAEVKLEFWLSGARPPGDWLINYIHSMVGPLIIIGYSTVILKMIRDKAKEINEYKNGITEAHLDWLKLFFYVLLVFGFVQGAAHTYYFITWIIPFAFNTFPLITFSIIIFSIAYFGIVQPERIFPPSFLIRANKVNGNKDKYIYALKSLMEDEKLYLNSELKYSEIAAKLSISARMLTEILNKEIGKSFYDFVNEYRIKEFCRRLESKEYSNYSLLGIAIDSGFSNKSSFNRIFKKHLDMTPTQYASKISDHKIRSLSKSEISSNINPN